MAKSPPRTAADLAAKMAELDRAEEEARKKIEAKKARLALQMLALRQPATTATDDQAIQAAVTKALAEQAAAHDQALKTLQAAHAAELAKATATLSLSAEKKVQLVLGHGLQAALEANHGPLLELSRVRASLQSLQVPGDWANARGEAVAAVDASTKAQR